MAAKKTTASKAEPKPAPAAKPAAESTTTTRKASKPKKTRLD